VMMSEGGCGLVGTASSREGMVPCA
jgi:hypothetical protein